MAQNRNVNDKNLCVAVVTTDSFVVGTLVTIYSFLKHNSWFDGEIVIICRELSERNREYLELVYDRIKFFSVNECLLARIDEVTKVFPEFASKQARFYSLETFRLRNYEKVLFLDSDLLVRGSVENLFHLKHQFIACGDGAFYNGRGRRWGRGIEESCGDEEIEVIYDTFNSGFFLVDNSLLIDDVYEGVLNLVDRRIYKTPNMKLADQVVLNLYFAGRQHLVGGEYNYLLAHATSIYEKEEINLTDARVLHFNGHQKPWMTEEVLYAGVKDPVFTKACGLWFNDYVECLHELHLQTQVRALEKIKAK